MSRRKKHQTKNPFLAQILLRYVGKMAPCQGVIHQQQEKPAQAEWEARMYQNFDMTLQLMEQGTPRDQVNQVIWNAACKEQDTVGIVNHKTMYLCSECAHQIASNHAGDAQTTLTMTTAMLAGGALSYRLRGWSTNLGTWTWRHPPLVRTRVVNHGIKSIWLTFGDRRICDRIENNRSFTFSSHGAFSYPDVHHFLVCLTFWP